MDPLQQPPSGTRKRKTSHINPMDMGETWDDDDAPWESEAQGYTIEASGRSLVLSNKQANELSEQYRYFGAAWGKGSHFKERGTKRLKWQDVPYSTCALVVAFLLEGKIILDILIDYPPTDSKSKSANEESNELELSTYTNFMQLCDKINVVPFFSNPKNPQENLCQDKEQMSLYLETYANLRAHTRVSRLIINSPEINALRRTDGFNDSFPIPDFLLTSGAITATPFLAIGSQRNDRRGKLTIMSSVSISALFHHFISIVDDLGHVGLTRVHSHESASWHASHEERGGGYANK
ncbi:hypothetical protein SEMRO_1526_G279800.1 [Seminavis robusta]|uniref:Uncharacterized protein n=1 Tax=Seminavis robusta TaxID=568900 RepID=A0A9N8HR52_9STRA|nr:hypothetical protein SEMRO_1526_G279800.1 [Seminavis robusta]|eukprot:Sro1526_g279800.1 n/a (294) ;mRNA; r:20774-21655